MSRPARTLAALARSGAFIQPLGHGWYRYHPLLAEVLRLKLRLESPDRTPGLHRQAASWYQRNGLLGKAVAHAAAVSDWQLAARIVVDELAVGELLKPRGELPGGRHPAADTQSPARFQTARHRHRPCWRPPPWSSVTAVTRKPAGLLAAAGECLDRLPAGHEIPSRLAAAMLRLAAARRGGDLDAARTAAARAETLFAAASAQPAELPPGGYRGTCCPAAAPSSSGPAIRTRRRWPSPVRRLPSRKTAASGRPVTDTSP